MSEAPSTPPTRVAWIDYAKGICIFAVVMFYANNYVEQWMQAPGWLGYVVEFARPFRMPDFFLISGLLLYKVIDRPWRTYLDKKVVHFFYFFALWTTFSFIAFDLRAVMTASSPATALVTTYLLHYIEPVRNLWFIEM